MSKRLSLLRVAARCIVLRSRWYQSGIKRLPVIRVKWCRKSVDDASRRFLCKPPPRPGYARSHRNCTAIFLALFGHSAKLRDGLKPSSVRYIHAVLHRALSKAVDLRLIARNPAASADPPKVRHEEMTPLDAQQTRTFLDAASGEKYEALYVLSLTCGLRMGESLGLKWSDIDLEAGTLRVNRQLQRMRKDGDKPGTLVFSEPKNASRRTIDLPQRALEALRIHRKHQLE
jgi:integrase